MMAFASPGNGKLSKPHAGYLVAEEEYNHQQECERLNQINKTLTELHEEMVKKNVRLHLLKVDLATQISPYKMEALQDAQESCNQCQQHATTTSVTDA